VKVLFNCEPSELTMTIMATDIPAAINPYSIAVAPDSLFTNRFHSVIMSAIPASRLGNVCDQNSIFR